MVTQCWVNTALKQVLCIFSFIVDDVLQGVSYWIVLYCIRLHRFWPGVPNKLAASALAALVYSMELMSWFHVFEQWRLLFAHKRAKQQQIVSMAEQTCNSVLVSPHEGILSPSMINDTANQRAQIVYKKITVTSLVLFSLLPLRNSHQHCS